MGPLYLLVSSRSYIHLIISPKNQVLFYFKLKFCLTQEIRYFLLYVFVFVFSSGHRNQVTCSLLGGFSKPRAEVIQLLDSGLCSI